VDAIEGSVRSSGGQDSAVAASTIYETGQYLEMNQGWHVDDSPFKAAQVKAILERNGFNPQTFVEVGCGAGAILSELAKEYPQSRFSGYEISPQAHELSKVRKTDRVQYYLADFLGTKDRYDCLLCMDVFEHVPDYMGFLEKLSGRADLTIFHIPLEINLVSILRRNMTESRKAVHLHYFNRDTALATLADCGYEIIDDFYTESFRRLPRPSLKNKITGLVYRLIFSRSKDLAVKLFGDCSLIVLAKPAANRAA
jgi:SAM-dependent methyltransferase